MIRRIALAAAFSLTGICACAHVEVTPAPGAAAPPRDQSCAVEVHAGRPERPFDELGTVRAVPASINAEPSLLQEMIREKACSLGGDAIVDAHEVLTADAPGKVMIGTVVRYK